MLFPEIMKCMYACFCVYFVATTLCVILVIVHVILHRYGLFLLEVVLKDTFNCDDLMTGFGDLARRASCNHCDFMIIPREVKRTSQLEV